VNENQKEYPVVDPAAAFVAYEERAGRRSYIRLAGLADQTRTTLCDDCGIPADFIDSDRLLIVAKGQVNSISLLNVRTRRIEPVLSRPDLSLGEPSHSPAAPFLAFDAVVGAARSQIFTVRVSDEWSPVSEWEPVTAEEHWSDKPRWSDDGRTLFFLSNMDGHSCLWSRAFDPATGRAFGPARHVWGFHDFQRSPDFLATNAFNISVAGGALYMNPADASEALVMGTFKSHFFDLPPAR
jgi:hypothetical protein